MLQIIFMVSFGISIAGIAGILAVRAWQLKRGAEPHEINEPHEEPMEVVANGTHGIFEKAQAVFGMLHKRHTEPLVAHVKRHAKLQVVRGVDILHQLSAKAKHALEGKRGITASEVARSPFFEEMLEHQMTGEEEKKVPRRRSAKKKAPPELPADAPVAGDEDPVERIEKVLAKRRKKTDTE